PAVLPSFEPIPRPTRTLRCRDPRGGFKLERFTDMLSSMSNSRSMPSTYTCLLLFDDHQMPDLEYHPANRRRISPLDDLVHPPEPEAANRLPHVPRASDKTSHPLDFQHSRCFFRHSS